LNKVSSKFYFTPHLGSTIVSSDSTTVNNDISKSLEHSTTQMQDNPAFFR
jgi:hypothetical protein